MLVIDIWLVKKLNKYVSNWYLVS